INCCSDMSTIVSSDQSSILFMYFVVASYTHQNKMPKIKTTRKAGVPSRPVSSAAKDPMTTAKFLDAIDDAMATFDDEITSLSMNQREAAYENLAHSYREAFAIVWDKAKNADTQPILDAISDKQLLEFKKLK
ncbi:MAG: hypothetical protein MPJ22_12900, partial [Pirellulales bacterium]|nr:hypothetical protein [Pirellulales bacterium]